MTTATNTGVQTIRLRSRDDWKIPEPPAVTGAGVGLAVCTAATTALMRIT